jgi:hypothetical protein
VASFDWILNLLIFFKILEDNYAKRENTRSSNSSATNDDLKKSAVSAVNAMYGITDELV